MTKAEMDVIAEILALRESKKCSLGPSAHSHHCFPAGYDAKGNPLTNRHECGYYSVKRWEVMNYLESL